MNRTDGREARRRRRSGGLRRRGPHDAGSGRRRADDDRDASAQHVDSRATSPLASCGSRFLGASVPPVVTIGVGSSVGWRHRCRRTSSGAGHRQVVFEREGLRLHRARGWGRRLRPLLRDHDGRLQDPHRRPACGVRGRPGSQGCPGRERRRQRRADRTRIDVAAGSREGARRASERIAVPRWRYRETKCSTSRGSRGWR